MLNPNEIEFLENNAQFWQTLTAKEKELIIEDTSCKRYGKGKNMFSSGQECLGLVIVKTGKLRTYIVSEDGREVTFCRLGAGDICILTASCVVHTNSVDVAIDVEETSEVFTVGTQCIRNIIANNAQLESFLLKATVDKLAQIIGGLQQILFMGMDKRMAKFLLEESKRLSSEEISLTHEQMAKYMGSAREVVSRMLKRFEHEGIVQLQRGSIIIIDRAKLLAI